MDSLIANFQSLSVGTLQTQYQTQYQMPYQPQQIIMQSVNKTPASTLCSWIGCNHGSSAMEVDDVYCPRRSERLAAKAPVDYKGMCK